MHAAPCPHFGECGGCTRQDLPDADYTANKQQTVAAALARAGYPASSPAPLVRTPPGDRRRAIIALRPGVAGLHRLRSHEVVDLQTCLVLDPALVALIPALRALHLDGLRRAGTAIANLLDNGIDLLLRTDAPLSPADRRRLAAFAAATGCMRVSWAQGEGPAEPACQLAAPLLTIAGATVSPPPGAFLQASRTGQAAITAATLAGLPGRLTGRSRVVELFAGCGTLTIPLASQVRVQAFEGDATATAALRRAAAGHRIEAVQRDLARQPLSAKELAGCAAIVLDPPYAGAPQQMRAIAQAGAPRIIYVSCNPTALARDGAVLHAAGYTLLAATPIDQFLWSDEVECVAVFAQPNRRQANPALP